MNQTRCSNCGLPTDNLLPCRMDSCQRKGDLICRRCRAFHASALTSEEWREQIKEIRADERALPDTTTWPRP